MSRVIYNADDAGATRTMTRRILDAWKCRLVDGFSIVANGEGCADIGAEFRMHADIPARIAVHLNLSEGKSSLPSEQVPLLVNSGGILSHGFVSLLAYWLRNSRPARERLVEQITKEWRMQIREVKALAHPYRLAVVDSHNHVHMLPFLFPLAAQLAQEEGIPGIRVVSEPFYLSSRLAENLRLRFAINILKHLVLRTLAARARRIALQTALSFPQSVVGVLFTGMMSAAAIRSGLRAARRRGSEEVEIILHIGRADPAEARRWAHIPAAVPFFLSEARDREFEALRRLREFSRDVS